MPRNSRLRAAWDALTGKPQIKNSGYDIARRDRLLNDFLSSSKTFNEELRSASLPLLRDRCRELARNDHSAIKFLSLLQKNVIGCEGIRMQPKVMMQRGGNPNKVFNQAIADAWEDWGQKENCTACKKFTWIQVQTLAVRSCAIDGEVFVRKLKRRNNPHGFTLQFIDPDQVDFFYNGLLSNGNRVIMGIEFNGDDAVVNYHVWNRPRGDNLQPRIRFIIPAEEIIHIYLPLSLFQARGVPWMVGAAYQMHMFKGYQEAEITAARVAACQMGFIQKDIDPNAEYSGEAAPPEQDSTGAANFEAQPGTFQALSAGEKIQTFSPEHPVTAYDPFTKACMRSIAAGLDVSYMSLSGDLTGASYSSARVGLLDERDTWSALQTWIIEALHEEVYENWIQQAFFTSLKAMPTAVLESDPAWHPRSFPWVDPEKDANAEILKVGNNMTTLTRVLNAQGYDFMETIDERAAEIEYMTSKGLQPVPATRVTETVNPPNQAGQSQDQTPPDQTANYQAHKYDLLNDNALHLDLNVAPYKPVKRSIKLTKDKHGATTGAEILEQ